MSASNSGHLPISSEGALARKRLPGAELTLGQTIAADRLYAIENGPSGFDPAAPSYLPKNRFLMLMRNERLAALDTQFDEASHVLTSGSTAREVAWRSADGGRPRRDRGFLRRLLQGRIARTAARCCSAAGHSFSDVAAKVISIINLASVAAVENAVGMPVDPLRFRGNLYVEGWPAWREFDLLDKTIAIGPARLKVVKRIVRCAATNVEPRTGIRDLEIPDTLMQAFGHMDCGVYAEVVTPGTIATGDAVSETTPKLPF